MPIILSNILMPKILRAFAKHFANVSGDENYTVDFRKIKLIVSLLISKFPQVHHSLKMSCCSYDALYSVETASRLFS